MAAIMLLTALLFIGGGGYGVARQVDDLRYAAGSAGTPGTYTVNRCIMVPAGSRGSRPRCEGVFRSNDGSVVDPSITLDFKEPVGTQLPIQHGLDGTTHQVGVGPIARDTAAISACLIVVLLSVLPLRVALSAASPRWGADIAENFGDTLPGIFTKWFGVAMTLTFIVSIAIYLMARLTSPF